MIGIMGVAVIVGYAANKLLNNIGFDYSGAIEKLNEISNFTGILVIITVVIITTVISFAISNHIMEHKEV